MREDLFLATHQVLATMANEEFINVNYDFYTPPRKRNGKDLGLISGVSMSTKRIQTFDDDSNYNIENILQQVEKISFDVTYESRTQSFELEIVNRSTFDVPIEGLTKPRKFFYFKVKPAEFIAYWPSNTTFDGDTDFNEVNLSGQSRGEQVYLFPLIENLNFSLNDFNPLIGNSIENRSSVSRQVADRDKLDINPVNIEPLLAQSATSAQIPESNYTITGLVNSRYEGTKTDAEKFGGVSPSFTGRTFTGEVFSNVVENSKISSSLEQDRVYQELFHSGVEELPLFRLVSSSYNLSGTAHSGKVLDVQPIPTASSGSLVNAGDILFISGSTVTQEFMRVEKTDLKYNRLFVERAYLSDRGINSKENNHISNQHIQLVQPTKLFEFGSGTTKVELVENAKVLVKESRLILETDKYGNVFTSSSIA